jgi:hypothetical protein
MWNSAHAHYVIDTARMFSEVSICKDAGGNTIFGDEDAVHNVTDELLYDLIEDGKKNSWFTKLPSHEQLMKRVKHTFAFLAKDTDNVARITTLLLTPKQVTLVWTPSEFNDAPDAPAISFESDDEGCESGVEPEIPESNLPPMSLLDDSQQSQEDYLLTRLRAAKARVEAEQIRMQYFETTGRMPPDSESDDD